MATRQLSFTDLADDGSVVEATIEVSGTDEQVQRRSAELAGLADRLRKGPMSRGPVRCPAALPAPALPAKVG